jgi:hypothetical protein
VGLVLAVVLVLPFGALVVFAGSGEDFAEYVSGHSIGLVDGDIFGFPGFVTGVSDRAYSASSQRFIDTVVLIRLSPHPIIAFPVCVISSRIVARLFIWLMVIFTSFHFQFPCQVPGDDADGDQHVDQFPVFVLGWIVHGKNLLSPAMYPGRRFFRSETKKSEKKRFQSLNLCDGIFRT